LQTAEKPPGGGGGWGKLVEKGHLRLRLIANPFVRTRLVMEKKERGERRKNKKGMTSHSKL